MGLPRGSTVKNPPATQELRLQTLGREDPLEEGRAAHPSFLAWRIPWTEKLSCYSPWGRKESDTTGSTSACTHTNPKIIVLGLFSDVSKDFCKSFGRPLDNMGIGVSAVLHSQKSQRNLELALRIHKS